MSLGIRELCSSADANSPAGRFALRTSFCDHERCADNVRIERIPRVKLIRVHYATQRTFVVQTLRRYHTFDETLTPHTPCARAPPELIYSTSLVK